VNAHLPIPHTLDDILAELEPDERSKASAAHTRARIRDAFQGAMRTSVTTEDGTVIITDPELGQSVSGRNREDGEAEIRRRKAIGRAA
jgi:hypothetical protein